MFVRSGGGRSLPRLGAAPSRRRRRVIPVWSQRRRCGPRRISTPSCYLCGVVYVCVAAVVDAHYRAWAPHRAVDAAMTALRAANAFVQSQRPWSLAAGAAPPSRDRAAVACTLHVGLETARVAALALGPVVPGLARRVLDRLGCGRAESSGVEDMAPRRVVQGGRPLGRDTGPLLKRVRRPPASSKSADSSSSAAAAAVERTSQ